MNNISDEFNPSSKAYKQHLSQPAKERIAEIERQKEKESAEFINNFDKDKRIKEEERKLANRQRPQMQYVPKGAPNRQSHYMTKQKIQEEATRRVDKAYEAGLENIKNRADKKVNEAIRDDLARQAQGQTRQDWKDYIQQQAKDARDHSRDGIDRDERER